MLWGSGERRRAGGRDERRGGRGDRCRSCCSSGVNGGGICDAKRRVEAVPRPLELGFARIVLFDILFFVQHFICSTDLIFVQQARRALVQHSCSTFLLFCSTNRICSTDLIFVEQKNRICSTDLLRVSLI